MIEALPERELRSLRLLLTGFYGVQKVGRVILIEYEVEGWVCYPDFFGAGDLRTVAAFKETVGGQPNPLEAVETVMHLTDYEYGGGIRVVLPPEAEYTSLTACACTRFSWWIATAAPWILCG